MIRGEIYVYNVKGNISDIFWKVWDEDTIYVSLYHMNKKDDIINTKVKYIFKKNNFQITTDKEEYIDYDKLYKVINTKDSFYLYINKNRALIVDKNNLKDEDITILNDKFKEKVPIYKEK